MVKLVLDVIKSPKSLTIVDIARKLIEVDGVVRVSIRVGELGVEAVTLTVSIEGTNIDFDKVRSVLGSIGVEVHGIDEITVVRDGGV